MYKLLTGHSPHDLSGAMFDLLHEIIEGKVRKPREIDKSIDPELEALLLKALAHKPEERYDSAGALATDIANYLDEEPLNARIPTTFYFLRKKAFKYKKQVGIATAVLTIIFVTVLAAYTKVVSERAVLRATEERNKLLEREVSNLKARILSGNPTEVESALRAWEEKYLAVLEKNQRLQQQSNQRSGAEEPLSSITGFSFVKPVNLGPPINTSARERGACISSDSLSLYFDSERPSGIGDIDIWVAKRSTVSESWLSVENLGPIVNSHKEDGQPHISADDLSLYFRSNRPGGIGQEDIWVSTRSSKNNTWGPPKNLGPGINTSNYDGAPNISPDGLMLYFESDRPGGYGKMDIWMSTRSTVSDPWGEAENLGLTVNTQFFEAYPCITSDGLSLFFHSNRSGKSEIWITQRTNVSDAWKAPILIGPILNGRYSEVGPYISLDASTLYFSSSRPGGYGDDDIWQITLYPSD
jgi:hypothetical protein